MTPRLARVKIGEKNGEEVIYNERTTIRVRKSRSSLFNIDSFLRISDDILNNPTYFLKEDSLQKIGKLVTYARQIVLQEEALKSLTKDNNLLGKVRWLETVTTKKVDSLLKEFATKCNELFPDSSDEITEEIELTSGNKLTTLSKSHKALFDQNRWFELVCYGLIRQAVEHTSSKYFLTMDKELLGRSGLWHETDIILMTPDFSTSFEVKSGRWFRDDLLKVLAQRDDTGLDVGVLLTLNGKEEDYEPISKAHPIRVFRLSKGRENELVIWMKEVIN